jgi:hypothetical protein
VRYTDRFADAVLDRIVHNPFSIALKGSRRRGKP